MKTFVIAMVALMAWDTAAKFYRLVMGRTEYSRTSIAVDGLFCVGFAMWGIWVLASS